MKISKQSQYGLRAMIYLAKNASKKNPCPLKEISKKEDISFDFLEKIMEKLQSAGLVGAQKGSQGGYFLAVKPEEITPGLILLALEGPADLVGCSGCPRSGACSSKDVWAEAQESLDNSLNAVTLKDLAK